MKLDSFENKALEIFKYQYQYNLLYQQYCKLLNKNINNVQQITDIPFLPISFFKNKDIKTTNFLPEKVFFSSGTTTDKPSKHFVKHILNYETSAEKCFQFFYGEVKNYCYLFLLPSYLERESSSLIYMATQFVKKSSFKESSFYLYNFEKLYKQLKHNIQYKIPTILFGVSFALLDFAEQYTDHFADIIIMETGGMKGRKKEISKADLHRQLKEKLNVKNIHSEYGMTELMSQSYSKGEGLFFCPPSMQILVRQIDNPIALDIKGRGGINIIDLNNIDSCSFIATDDYGIVNPNHSFEILGRINNSDIRGCNQLLDN